MQAQTTVDDRALNRGVADALREALAHVGRPGVLELDAGVGTMVQRLLEW